MGKMGEMGSQQHGTWAMGCGGLWRNVMEENGGKWKENETQMEGKWDEIPGFHSSSFPICPDVEDLTHNSHFFKSAHRTHRPKNGNFCHSPPRRRVRMLNT